MVDSTKVGCRPRYSANATADSGWQTPVDIRQREAGVLQRVQHHGDFELSACAVELAGGGHVVGHADDGRRAAQAAVFPAHPRDPPVPSTQPWMA